MAASCLLDSSPCGLREVAVACVDGDPGCKVTSTPHLMRVCACGLVTDERGPSDRFHAIYFAMLLAGVGFLLPYNSFITDVDYLHHKYPGGRSTPAHSPLPAAFLGCACPGSPELLSWCPQGLPSCLT